MGLELRPSALSSLSRILSPAMIILSILIFPRPTVAPGVTRGRQSYNSYESH